MRSLLYIPIIFLTLISFDTNGQSFVANSCDSSKLTKQEFEKCMADTAWKKDIIITANYITNLKTNLLPNYRKIRKELILSEDLLTSLRLLKTTYDNVLNNKLTTFQIEMDKNQKYLQPKAYLSSLLSLQTFRFYPDVYAILLNDIHLQLKPKTSIAGLNSYNKLVDKVYRSIGTDLHQKLEEITTTFTDDNHKLKADGFSPQFQGTQSEAEIKKYRIINFLLWAE